MHKIVITGGPGAGKTEIMSYLTQALENRGYKVIIVPESATDLILNGIHPSETISMESFQDFVLDLQIAREDIWEKAAHYHDKLIVFCDRGIMDACAYVDMRPTFENMLSKRRMTLSDAYNRYDAVLHLVTAADGAEQFYQWNNPEVEDVGNNAARSESPEEARIKDQKTLNSWIGHPRLRVFDNSTNFEGKVKRVISEVFALLGEPIPTEIERKYLIKRPTNSQLEALGYLSETTIVQTYLDSSDGVERRVRQRGTQENGYSFYYTEKKDIGHGERVENEQRISASEYIAKLATADTSLHQISKTRYCFIYDSRYFELDIYPFSDEYAILEIEMNDINEKINLPPLEIIKDVTDDPGYKNHSLAKTLTLAEDISKIEIPPMDVSGLIDCANDFSNEMEKYNQVLIAFKSVLTEHGFNQIQDDVENDQNILIEDAAGWVAKLVDNQGNIITENLFDNAVEACLEVIKSIETDENETKSMIREFKIKLGLKVPTEKDETPKIELREGVWVYETGRVEPCAMSAGTWNADVFVTTSEAEAAIQSQEKDRNYLRRLKRSRGIVISEYYDFKNKHWK